MEGPGGDAATPLLVVDAANVVGSVPDGWWRDRPAATRRLRDALVGIAARGLPGTGTAADAAGTDATAWTGRPVEVVLVVEGAARRVESTGEVQVVGTPGSGDDLIVELVRQAGTRRCAVVTADRELRARVAALGAAVLGPRTVRPARPPV